MPLPSTRLRSASLAAYGQPERILLIDLLLGEFGFDGVGDPRRKRNALNRHIVQGHEPRLEVKFRDDADPFLDGFLRGIDLFGF